MKRSFSPRQPSQPSRHTQHDRGWSDDLVRELKCSLEKLLTHETDGIRDDIVGEVLLRVIARDRQHVRHPFAYARRAAQNLLRDRIRDLDRCQKMMDELASSGRFAASYDGAAGSLEDCDLLKCLLKRTQLSPIQLQIIDMIYFDGKTITQTARTLDKNPGTVHRHHDRAIQKLARCGSQLQS